MTEFASILLFLLHLSKESLIIEEMLKAAELIFAESPEARLDTDVDFLNALDTSTKKLSYQDGDFKSVREEMLHHLDQQDGDGSDADDTILFSSDESVESTVKPIRTINAALKTMQILGQLLKNFPGSIEGATKLRIAKSISSLGLRCLGSLFGLFCKNEDEILTAYYEA